MGSVVNHMQKNSTLNTSPYTLHVYMYLFDLLLIISYLLPPTLHCRPSSSESGIAMPLIVGQAENHSKKPRQTEIVNGYPRDASM